MPSDDLNDARVSAIGAPAAWRKHCSEGVASTAHNRRLALLPSVQQESFSSALLHQLHQECTSCTRSAPDTPGSAQRKAILKITGVIQYVHVQIAVKCLFCNLPVN